MKKVSVRGKSFLARVVRVPKFIETSKTVTVAVEQRIYDSKYKRYYKKVRKYLVHYEPKPLESLKLGDVVRVHNCRRLSPRKSKIIV